MVEITESQRKVYYESESRNTDRTELLLQRNPQPTPLMSATARSSVGSLNPTLLGRRITSTISKRKTLMEPEKRLMMAILEDAIHCFQDNVLAKTGKARKLFQEAEEWVLKEGADWIFSFRNVCELLELDPEYLRAGLTLWKQKRLAHETL